MLLSNPFAGAFGLNIDDLSLKLVQLRPRHTLGKKENFTVNTVRTLALPPGLIVNGEIEQPEMVRKKLLRLLGAEGDLYPPIRSKWVVADLPEPKTFLKLITIDTPRLELTNDEIKYQAKKHLPFELEETYLDWQFVNPEENKQTSKILLGAIPKTIADAYTYLLESADLIPLALEVEAIAISRIMITEQKSYVGEARAVLDLGATRSGLIVFDHNSIQFTASIPFSGEIITTAIMQNLKLDYLTAEKLKISTGLAHSKSYPRYLKIIGELTDSLTDGIKKALTFYKEHFPDTNPVTHITMCGGAANLLNLNKLIASKLKISAKPGNSWKNLITKQPTEEEKARGLLLTSALGLALRAAQNPRLLPL